MSYSTHNSFYLRISKSTVLPIHIYLDERHVKWMSDQVLQHVLSDLRPHILSKLKAEADQLTGPYNGKKATVDTHRGDTYQFCYFICKTEQHSVVIKTRNFRTISQQKQKQYVPTSKKHSSKTRGKRKEVSADDVLPTTAALKRKKRKTHNEAATQSESTNADVVDLNMDSAEEQLPTNSKSKVDSVEIGAAPMDDTIVIHLEVDSEEEKPKPVLHLTYQGFNIYGQCLCVVVEPWPVMRSMSANLTNSRRKAPIAGSTLGAAQQRTSRHRDKRTPLFLPEDLEKDDERVEISTPQEQISITDIADGDSDSDGIGGMMEFSQVLRSIGDSRSGTANDDEDMDGSVLFGDADEFREL